MHSDSLLLEEPIHMISFLAPSKLSFLHHYTRRTEEDAKGRLRGWRVVLGEETPPAAKVKQHGGSDLWTVRQSKENENIPGSLKLLNKTALSSTSQLPSTKYYHRIKSPPTNHQNTTTLNHHHIDAHTTFESQQTHQIITTPYQTTKPSRSDSPPLLPVRPAKAQIGKGSDQVRGKLSSDDDLRSEEDEWRLNLPAAVLF
ncbi:hypothetical protein Droror1_Dr00006658 [Drosera rotundifolia]